MNWTTTMGKIIKMEKWKDGKVEKLKTKIPKDLVIGNKWPQMMVKGKSITIDQAKEIIFRTDRFFVDFHKSSGGNNDKWNKWARNIFGYSKLLNNKEFDTNNKEFDIEEFRVKFEKSLKFLQTEYVHNSWASCAYVYGPYGWCHPDGKIYYCDNVGKWPSVEAIVKDWQMIIEAFPFLDLTLTIFDGESCNEKKSPIFSLKIKDEKIEFTDNHLKSDIDDDSRPLLFLTRREQGLPDSWIKEFGYKSREIIEKYLTL